MNLDQIPWKTPWAPVGDGGAALCAELAKELPAAHDLAGQHVRAVARRTDKSLVLFQLDDGRLAVVHLTETGTASPRAQLPWTVFYRTPLEFVRRVLDQDTEAFETFA
jgi:hypothetical protein